MFHQRAISVERRVVRSRSEEDERRDGLIEGETSIKVPREDSNLTPLEEQHLVPSFELAAAVVDQKRRDECKHSSDRKYLYTRFITDHHDNKHSIPEDRHKLNNNNNNNNKHSIIVNLSSLFKRILLDVSSLRIISSHNHFYYHNHNQVNNASSTAATRPAAATAAGSTNLTAIIHTTLSLLLKSLLIASYYLIAFSSLILLILYISNHYHVFSGTPSSHSQHNNHLLDQSSNNRGGGNGGVDGLLLASTKTKIKQILTLTTISRNKELIFPAPNEPPSNLQSNHYLKRFKRSDDVDSMLDIDDHQRTKPAQVIRIPSVYKLASNYIQKIKLNNERSSSNKPPPSKLIQEKPDDQYSKNNRGVMQSNNRINKIKSDLILSASSWSPTDTNQWIPIVNKIGVTSYNRPQHQPKPKPKPMPMPMPMVRSKSSVGYPVESSSMNVKVAQGSHHHRMNKPSGGYSREYPNLNHLNRAKPEHNYPYQSSHHHNYKHMIMRHPEPAPTNRHWKRPKVHYSYDNNKIMFEDDHPRVYKELLRFEKTLVSLEYSKGGFRGFDPWHVFGNNHIESYDDEDGDNVIDLDTRSQPTFDIAPLEFEKRSKNSTQTLSQSPEVQVSVSSNDIMRIEKSLQNSRRRQDRIQKRYYSSSNEGDVLIGCNMWDLEKGSNNRKPPANFLSMAIRVDFDTVRDAINRCRKLTEREIINHSYNSKNIAPMSIDDLKTLYSVKRGLIPGTKWCGLGDIANNYNDIGPNQRIDVCCRAHDHCPIRLKPFKKDYGKLNLAFYTKSHCECDADFYRCLKEAKSTMATALGKLYFNVLKLQCLKEERSRICIKSEQNFLGIDKCTKWIENPDKIQFTFTSPAKSF